MNNFQQCGAKATCSDAAISLKPQTVTTVLTKYNKAFGAGIGGAGGAVIAYFFPDIPFEAQEAMVVLLAMFGAWAFPKNKGT